MKASTSLVFLFCCFYNGAANINSMEENINARYSIEGRVFPPDEADATEWQIQTKIHVNSGEFIGFIRDDGSFVVHNVPSGSYIVEVVNPDYLYEPVRVEINSKGKFRARKVNYVQASQVIQVPYPLKLKPLTKFRYFQLREQWRMTDFLFNPMVMMMVLPLLLIMALPKMMNDPETKEEFKHMSEMTNLNYEVPEVSQFLASFLNDKKPETTKPNRQLKKRQ